MAAESLKASLNLDRYQNQEVNRFVSTPEQLLALKLARELSDEKNKLRYLHWAKHLQTGLLEQVLSFVADASARDKGKLFSWKLQQMRREWLAAGKNPYRQLPPPPKPRPRPGKQMPLF